MYVYKIIALEFLSELEWYDRIYRVLLKVVSKTDILSDDGTFIPKPETVTLKFSAPVWLCVSNS